VTINILGIVDEQCDDPTAARQRLLQAADDASSSIANTKEEFLGKLDRLKNELRGTHSLDRLLASIRRDAERLITK